jgi:protein SCO1/2
MKGISLGVLATLAALGCAREPAHTVQPATAKPFESAAVSRTPAPARADASAPSVYELESKLRDDQGHVSALDRFRGHPVLVTMFYGSCASACPLLTTELKRIEQRLPESARADLRVLMVSFDEARDTPEVLARLKRERGMDAARWTLASASDDEARELAGVLGIRYRKLDNGEFFHSSVIVLLDEAGRPVVRLSGVGEDLSAIVAAATRRSS